MRSPSEPQRKVRPPCNQVWYGPHKVWGSAAPGVDPQPKGSVRYPDALSGIRTVCPGRPAAGAGPGAARWMQSRPGMTSVDPIDIARDLLGSLDQLIAAVEDEPVLHRGLLRERARLLHHLNRCLSPPPDGPPPLRLEELPPPPRGQAAGPPDGNQLRRALYDALVSDLIDGRRFDAVMLLEARSRSYTGSASSTASAAASGSSGVAGRRGGTDVSPPWRTKRSKLSTRSTCA